VASVRTVLGDVPAADLGVCDAHDHLFFRSVQLAGQELDDADAGGGDTTAAARSSTGGGPGLPYLLRVLRPRLAAGLGEEVAARFFTANPARAFSWGCDSSSVPVT
jgi:predicted metal-dependent phosphotriesterase family hydrolase